MSRVRVALAVGLVLVLSGAFVAWQMLSGKESTDDARVDGHVYAVSAKIGGTVDTVEVIENQFVDAGAVLVKLDQREFVLALQKAEADLANVVALHREAQTQLPVSSVEAETQLSTAEAGLARAHSTVKTAQRDLEVARARLNTARTRVKEAQVNSSKAAKDLERMKPLIAKDEISQQQYDAFEAAAESARAAESSAAAAVLEAESGVALAEARVTEANSSVRIAETEIDAAKAAPHEVTASQARISAASAEIDRFRTAVEQARLNLEYTTIVAPVAGLVSKKNVEKGSVIQAGQPLMAVVPLDDVWITANFKETQLRDIHPGQDAEVRVDAYGSTVFHARVDSISAATGARFSLLPPENASGNFVKVVQRVPVKIVLTEELDPNRTLRPGMSVEVTVITGKADSD